MIAVSDYPVNILGFNSSLFDFLNPLTTTIQRLHPQGGVHIRVFVTWCIDLSRLGNVKMFVNNALCSKSASIIPTRPY